MCLFLLVGVFVFLVAWWCLPQVVLHMCCWLYVFLQVFLLHGGEYDLGVHRDEEYSRTWTTGFWVTQETVLARVKLTLAGRFRCLTYVFNLSILLSTHRIGGSFLWGSASNLPIMNNHSPPPSPAQAQAQAHSKATSCLSPSPVSLTGPLRMPEYLPKARRTPKSA